MQAALTNIREDPLSFLKRFGGKIIDLWGPERFIAGELSYGTFGEKAVMFAYPFALISNLAYLWMAIFFIKEFLKPNWDAMKYFTSLLVILYSFAYAVFFGHPHYHLALFPLISIYSSHSFIDWLHRRNNKLILQPKSKSYGLPGER